MVYKERNKIHHKVTVYPYVDDKYIYNIMFLCWSFSTKFFDYDNNSVWDCRWFPQSGKTLGGITELSRPGYSKTIALV